MSGHFDDLRAWAKGLYPIEAATELMIRSFGGKFATQGNPWVHARDTDGEYETSAWIDFESIPDLIGPLSGGERRVLMIAASLADVGVPVVLGDVLPGLDVRNQVLVVAAMSHAAGNVVWPKP